MKHSIAIAGALMGMGIAVLIDAGTLSIVLGLCLGLFLGYFFAGLYTAKQTLLQQGFAQLGDLRGKTLDEIVTVVGPYKEMTTCTITDRDNAPGFFYTWYEGRYLVVLLFDANNICIGVSKEINN